MAKAKQKQEEMNGVKGETEELHSAISTLVNAYKDLSDQKTKVASAKEVAMKEMKKAKRERIKFEGYIIKHKETSERVTISKEPNKE